MLSSETAHVVPFTVYCLILEWHCFWGELQQLACETRLADLEGMSSPFRLVLEGMVTDDLWMCRCLCRAATAWQALHQSASPCTARRHLLLFTERMKHYKCIELLVGL